MLKSRSRECHRAHQNKMAALADEDSVVFGDDFDEILNILEENEKVQKEFERAIADVSTQLF